MFFAQQNAEEYARNGFTVVRGGFSPKATEAMLKRLTDLVAKWDLRALRQASKPFVTYDQSNRSSDEWFLTSGDQVRPFFEEEGEEPVVNKVGHALHELDPLFRQLVQSEKIRQALRALGYESPVPIQSMFIAKSAKVGGEVSAHQDSTFLITNPHSVCGIWIALKKATTENGCMYFVPGSHKTTPIRQAFVRDVQDPGRTVFEPPTTEPYNLQGAVAVEADVGDVVVFHGSVIHYSATNRSPIPRPAYVMHFSERKCGWHPRNWLQSRFFEPLYGADYRIPVIDLGRKGADLDRAWDLAMSRYGFAVVTGHGMDDGIIQLIRAQAREFFDKPEAFKRKFLSGGYGESGYNPFATEAVADVNRTPDPLESFYIRQDLKSHPQEIQSFLKACLSYREAVDRHVLFPLLELSGRALGLDDETALAKAHKNHYQTLKVSHYPGQQKANDKSITSNRYGAHTDWEGFTILLPDETDDWENGMEALLPNGRWVSCGPIPPNAFIVNAGDFLPIWTRGRWHSPVHRVTMNDKTRDRFTIPYFTGPNLQSLVQPLTIDYLDDAPKVESVIAGEWLRAKIARAKI